MDRSPAMAAGSRRRGARLAAWLLFAAALAAWLWVAGRERRALSALPAAERQALVERTLQTLRGICAEPEERRPLELCREQAELVLRLPECDAGCQAAALAQLPNRPTR